jgi:hypothetical protein
MIFIDPIDKNSDEYKKRINHLLGVIKKERWEVDIDDTPKTKRGRKPKPLPQPKVDMENPRNKKFFKFL